MRYFLKFNALSAIFAFFPFIWSELLVNVYRINRITGVDIAFINGISLITGLLCFSLLIVMFVFMIQKRFLPLKRTNLLFGLYWIPYYFLYILLFSSQFPMNEQADKASPASGLIIMAGLLIYIFILTGMNAIALFSKEHFSFKGKQQLK